MAQESTHSLWDAVRSSTALRYSPFIALTSSSIALMPYGTGLPLGWGLAVGIVGIALLSIGDFRRWKGRPR
jgi:hypothetical protein